jgi:hypothetical protein
MGTHYSDIDPKIYRLRWIKNDPKAPMETFDQKEYGVLRLASVDRALPPLSHRMLWVQGIIPRSLGATVSDNYRNLLDFHEDR